MSRESIEKIINSKKIKYSVLEELFYNHLNKRTHYGKNINIFIDIENLIKQLYSENIMTNFSHIKDSDRIIISAELTNIIAHYRHYFASRKHMYTTFYKFYSDKKSEYHTNINPEYRKEFYAKRSKNNNTFAIMNNVMNYSLSIMKNVMNYIPHAFYFNTGKIESNLIPYFIMNNHVDEKDYNLIVSNNTIYRQHLKNFNNLFLLELRSDNSKILTSENIIDELLSKTKKDASDYPNINFNSIDLITILSANKDYNYKTVKGYGPVRTLSVLNKKVTEEKYDNFSKLDEDVIKDVFEDNISGEIIDRYKMLNHEYIVSNVYHSLNDVVESQMISLNNPGEMKKLNNDVFSNSPLMLDFLFEGER